MQKTLLALVAALILAACGQAHKWDIDQRTLTASIGGSRISLTLPDWGEWEMLGPENLSPQTRFCFVCPTQGIVYSIHELTVPNAMLTDSTVKTFVRDITANQNCNADSISLQGGRIGNESIYKFSRTLTIPQPADNTGNTSEPATSVPLSLTYMGYIMAVGHANVALVTIAPTAFITQHGESALSNLLLSLTEQ